jgi:anthranilate synthase/aminodeoxychorismate synthase-like glutamine amidotransferase
MRILVIDNYDSFTYNLVQLVGKICGDILVRRNDRTDLKEIDSLSPDKVIISPGPGRPEGSNISLDVIKGLGQKIPVLGVCLGHQGIGISFGAQVVSAQQLMHGKASQIVHDQKSIFKGIPQHFIATRYHSLIIEKETIPDVLEVSAETEDGTIMAVRHKQYPIEGIQFHPESILTSEGISIIKNWINMS